jgi:hypothetical protein
MTERRDLERARQPVLGPLAVGVGSGVLLGIFTVSVLPEVAFAVVGLLSITAGIAMGRRSIGGPKTAFLAGASIGAGGVLLFGAVNTIAACWATEDFCGQADVVPILALALGALGIGLLSAVTLAVRLRRVTR